MNGQSRMRTGDVVLLCAIAMVVALALDGLVTHLVKPIAAPIKHSELAEETKEFGNFGFTIFFAVFVAFMHRSSWRGGLMVCLSAALTGLFNPLVKWMVGRGRPVVSETPFSFDPFRGGWEGLLNETNLSFPSGHAAVAFATASALAYLMPKGKWLFYLLACAVGFERVGERAHFLSDVVASAILGVVSTWLAILVCKPQRDSQDAQMALAARQAATMRTNDHATGSVAPVGA